MIKIIEYNNSHKQTWNEFLQGSKNGIFLFDRNFMDYHSDRFIDNSLMFYDDEELIALLPMSKHDSQLRSHGGLTFGGFIVNSSMKQHKMINCFEILKDYMKAKKYTSLIYKAIPYIYHIQPSQEDMYALFDAGAKIFKTEPSTTIDLTNPGKLTKGRKAQISRAKREGVIIEQSEDFDTFIQLENTVLEKHNTKAVHTAEELKLLHSRFPNEIQLWTAVYEEKIIAASVIFVSRQTVHTQYLAADEKSREIGALDLLIKTLIDNFSSEKKFFDFGISTEENGKYLNEGLISQKESFGGRTVCYNTMELII